jgi:hypothetical protein
MITNEIMIYLEYLVNSPSELEGHTPESNLTLKQINDDKGNIVYNMEV